MPASPAVDRCPGCSHNHPPGSKCVHDTVYLDDRGHPVETYRCDCVRPAVAPGRGLDARQNGRTPSGGPTEGGRP